MKEAQLQRQEEARREEVRADEFHSHEDGHPGKGPE